MQRFFLFSFWPLFYENGMIFIYFCESFFSCSFCAVCIIYNLCCECAVVYFNYWWTLCLWFFITVDNKCLYICAFSSVGEIPKSRMDGLRNFNHIIGHVGNCIVFCKLKVKCKEFFFGGVLCCTAEPVGKTWPGNSIIFQVPAKGGREQCGRLRVQGPRFSAEGDAPGGAEGRRRGKPAARSFRGREERGGGRGRERAVVPVRGSCTDSVGWLGGSFSIYYI